VNHSTPSALKLTDALAPGSLPSSALLMALCVASTAGSVDAFMARGWWDIVAVTVAGVAYGMARAGMTRPMLEATRKAGGWRHLGAVALDATVILTCALGATWALSGALA